MARRDGIDSASLERVAALLDRDAIFSEASFRRALKLAGWPDFLRDRAVRVVRSEHALVRTLRRRVRTIGVANVVGLALLGYAIARWFLGAAVVHAALVFVATVALAAWWRAR